MAGAVESYQAPPATDLQQALQDQIPTAFLFTESYIEMLISNEIRAYLSTEWAGVDCTLGDFKLFDGFSLSCTISCAVLSTDAYLLSSLCHYYIY